MSNNNQVPPVESMTHERAIELAKTLASTIRQQVNQAEALRRQPEEMIEDLVRSGLLRLLTPKRWGGHELTFDTVIPVTLELAKADASSGWCSSLFMIHSWLLAHFPEAAQHEVWASNPDALIATSLFPAGQASEADGGYRLSGSWGWASGVDSCHWIALSAKIAASAADKGPQLRAFLLPRQNFQIQDTWFVAGLAASGSNQVVVEDVFVPFERSVPLQELLQGHAPGLHLNPSPLYQIPLALAYPSVVPAAILGTALGAYEIWREASRSKWRQPMPQQVAALARHQIRLAETSAELDAAYLLLQRAVEVLRLARAISPELHNRTRRDYAYIVRLCLNAIERLYLNSGAGSNYVSNPLQRYWRDIHAMAGHTGVSFDAAGEAFGRFELGLPPDPQDLFAPSSKDG
ncbi:acyl-CoA dehydrogenase [Ktedonosporobacter rubrisoli]|uniref:Acyl-CoA dehydrogenase n=1 Tax=Ktedonosporobacter rubrisoli TaxID=2509675 RepID=A0A4P6K4X7_KTERU|nr:acyl-CoA dehydrogenase family protein [Ktedonosporobacter rubrisoli]QBD82983.1 acyl-CoA dehydrogenase [Ktedonosporobacter rubrisoli]